MVSILGSPHTFFILVYLSVYTDSRELQVVDSGLMKMKKDDMVVVFFLTVKHNGQSPRRAMIATMECCEKITDDETDCDLMDLWGGDFGIIQPGSVHNFTLLYPNLYGYNRKGACVVNVLHRCLSSSESEEIHYRVNFDTSVSIESVPPMLEGWYDPNTFIPCDSPDLDPFDHCNPVDCKFKYSGNRNFFSRKWKLCQRVPVCNGDPNKELPDVAYIPSSNTCRNLEKAITKKDIDMLVNQKQQNTQKMVNIRCHHGEINPKTGLCVCDYGWKSEIFDPDSHTGEAVYSMCNIQCRRDDPYYLVPYMLGFVLALWLFLCIICCEKLCWFCPGKKQANKPYNHQVNESSQGHGTTCMAVVTSTKSSMGTFKAPEFNVPRHIPEKPLKKFRGRSMARSKFSFFFTKKS
ncbi:hypothetical protein RUM43_007978 [Polyplax serrata]|uniref:Uncharacterized protein n=1 Tax=Polyplax serrata TaxID=468196 RepID=A0AAN8Q6N2_POLSC